MSTQGFGKDAQTWYSRWTWWITPKQPGEFKITRDLFERLPEGSAAFVPTVGSFTLVA